MNPKNSGPSRDGILADNGDRWPMVRAKSRQSRDGGGKGVSDIGTMFERSRYLTVKCTERMESAWKG
jgi:hypothetical protein